MIVWAMAAWAQDPSPAWIHPSATPLEALDAELALDGALVLNGPFGGVRGLVAVADGVALGGQVVATPCDLCESVGSRQQLWASWEVTPGDAFNVAPYVQLSAGTPVTDMDDFLEGFSLGGSQPSLRRSPLEVTLMPGLALEGGSPRVRFDLTAAVPLWLVRPEGNEAYLWREQLVYWVGEAGLTARLGREMRHSLRLGSTSYLPSLSWRYERGPAFVETGLMLGGLRAQIGLRPWKKA